MIINPELRRYLWLEFTPQRLILTPVIISIILYLGYITNLYSVQNTAYLIFLFYLYIWGTKLASEAIPDELNQRTWDYQRLSAIKPWKLAWGKLIGSTSYAWYGALIALIPYTIMSLKTEPSVFVVNKLIVLLLGGLLAHAAALVASMNTLQWEKTKNNTFFYWIFGLFFSHAFTWPALHYFVTNDNTNYVFYGLNLTKAAFAFYSLCLFLAWMLIGLYRRLRMSLQYVSLPWAWLLFTAFCMAYIAESFNVNPASLNKLPAHSLGVFYDKIHFPYYIALYIGALLTYIALFSDKITLRLYSKIKNDFKFKRVLAYIPYWTASFLVTVIMAIVIAILSPASIALNDISPLTHTFIPAVFLLSFILFFMRDIALIHYFKFSDTPHRSSGTAIFYLLILYVLIPSVLLTLHSSSILITLFLPSSADTWILSLLAPAIELVFVLWLIKKYRMIQKD